MGRAINGIVFSIMFFIMFVWATNTAIDNTLIGIKSYFFACGFAAWVALLAMTHRLLPRDKT